MMYAVRCLTVLLNLLLLRQGSCLNESIELDMSISYTECKDKCTEWAKCKSAQYFVSFKLCKLYDVKLDPCDEQTLACTNDKGVKYYMKPDHLMDVQNNIPQEPRVCPSPPPKKHAAVFGNMRTFGSRIKYVCKKDDRQWAISMCQIDGTWTKVDLICITTCGSPQFNWNQGRVIFGPIYAINDTHFTTNLSCHNNKHELRKLHDGIVCSIFDGVWYGIEFVCCNPKIINTRTRMYMIHNGTNTARTAQWNPDNDTTNINDRRNGIIGEKCFYQNTEFWDNWHMMGIDYIKLKIANDNEKNIVLTFWPDKSSSSNSSWFSLQALASTSKWTDILGSSDVDFSLKKDWYGGTLDFVAVQTFNDGPCETRKGWFMITDRYYPCGHPNHAGKRILYAKNTTAAAFVDGEVEFAKRLAIWVKFK